MLNLSCDLSRQFLLHPMGNFSFHRQAGRWVDGQMPGWTHGQIVRCQPSEQHFSLGASRGYWGSGILLRLHTAHTKGKRAQEATGKTS